jgi:hypothetical protein
MPIESPSDTSLNAEHLLHMETSMEALNARIARLAIGLGVSPARYWSMPKPS